VKVKTWQQRLAEMDHSKGTLNSMLQSAMKAEILELRAALRRQTARADRNKESSKRWREAATRYQKLAATMRSKPNV
jgi:transposase